MSTPTPPPSDPGPPPGQGPSPYGQGHPPYGQQGPQQPPYGPQYPQQPSYGQQQYGGYDPYASGLPQSSFPIPRDPDARPVTVTLAAWITIALSVLTALGWILVAVALGWMLDEMAENPTDFDLSPSDVQSVQDNRPAVYAMVAVFVVASVVSLVVSVFVLRRQAWARIALVVLASLTIITSLVMILSFVSVLWLVAGIAVIVLLFSGGANEWFSRSGPRWDSPYGGGGGYPSYGQQGSTYGQQGPPAGW
ncbi:MULTISPECIES: hypothetical protein [Mumia]|uniref:hypothetical protein n=1 Tax=Mumia TaxID=1546255 RepID=UPI00141E7ACD|nr:MULTISPECIES: hypothetical protein [unclassified Mumia]QMW67397.1 hypothetical protein H4N58_05700 [Mumia sp. ZJ1417]